MAAPNLCKIDQVIQWNRVICIYYYLLFYIIICYQCAILHCWLSATNHK